MDDAFNGYANRETWAFNLHWQNDYVLYHSVLDYAKACLRRVPNMTPQTLGRNVKDTVNRWCSDGNAVAPGWQDWDYDIEPAILSGMRSDVGSFWRVSETEVGEAVLESLEVEA